MQVSTGSASFYCAEIVCIILTSRLFVLLRSQTVRRPMSVPSERPVPFYSVLPSCAKGLVRGTLRPSFVHSLLLVIVRGHQQHLHFLYLYRVVFLTHITVRIIIAEQSAPMSFSSQNCHEVQSFSLYLSSFGNVQ